MKFATLIAGLAVVVLTGCAVKEGNRADRLMAIAAEETGAIQDPADRLTRLLNLAELQTDQGYAMNARKSLARAAETLSGPGGKLSAHTRIAGWVSISYLSRRADDPVAAGTACDNAMKEIRSIQTLAERCQYVRGVADEDIALRGKSASAAVLNESRPWVASIENQAERRLAATAIASDLFHCDDYDGGKAMLQAEKDPAWRVDTLIAMAKEEQGIQSRGVAGSWTAGLRQQAELDHAPATRTKIQYGKSVTYQSNFQGQQQVKQKD